jgi:glycosyltransferase involved in cell wall biosynthesis
VAFGVSTFKKRPPIITRVSTTMNQVFKEYVEPPKLNYQLAARFEISQIKRSDFLITHTKNHAKIIAKDIGIDPSRFSIIPHAVSLTKSPNPNINNVSFDNSIRVLFVGRLEVRKGIDILISAIPKIMKIHKNVIFDICGSGDPLIYKLEPSIQKKVFFHGYQSRDSLEEFYKTCDIFVEPSIYESFGLVYLEAMKYGKPVVACNSGGTPEVIEHKKTGLLVEPGKVKPLLKAILRLIGDSSYRHQLGNSGKKRCEELFSIRRLLDSTLLSYRTVLRNSQPN